MSLMEVLDPTLVGEIDGNQSVLKASWTNYCFYALQRGQRAWS